MVMTVRERLERHRCPENHGCGVAKTCMCDLAECAVELLERREKALRDIESWARAYPLKVFPEPDMKKAAALLAAGNMTLDAVSASAIRHTLTGIECLVRDGLRNE